MSFEMNQPGEVDTVVKIAIQNIDSYKTLTLLSGEFKELNKKVVRPREKLVVSFLVPEGYREFFKETSYKNNKYMYIGLIDKDAAAPLVHKPSL
jgi:hypothetical protein